MDSEHYQVRSGVSVNRELDADKSWILVEAEVTEMPKGLAYWPLEG
jgi:hypothetical protein